ncbi:MAG: hypothetical protein J6Y16_01755 [Treponema sp.]|nr:hypothetical protein [Treponema sp.]MBP5450942.1 hypothetical protein [Treponema sp.]
MNATIKTDFHLHFVCEEHSLYEHHLSEHPCHEQESGMEKSIFASGVLA